MVVKCSGMGDILLETKLSIPATRPGLVLRQRLIDRLNAGFERRLTLISAPAGFGKTTLLSEWAKNCARPVAWVSLEESDNDPARFMDYLSAALAPWTAQVSELQPSLSEIYLSALLNRLAAAGAQAGQHYALLLDDYHVITNEAIHQGMDFIISHLPACLHLYIATRLDPPLHLARLRARGQLNELRQDDLRFTLEESTQFLRQVMKLDLPLHGITALTERTEGWVAGLQLAAVSLQGRADTGGTIAAFTGSNRYVLDYLIEEVLGHQTQEIQDFLLRTSILDQLSASLCQALLDPPFPDKEAARLPLPSFTADLPRLDPQATLEYLERANLFLVPLDDRRHWYRYHHLFAGFLHDRLLHKAPELVAVLHRSAADWYEGQGMLDDAIEHTLSAQDFDQAARLVEQAAVDTLQHSQVLTLKRWIEAIPESSLGTRPALFLYHAWTLLLSGYSLESVLARLEQADQSPDVVPGQAAVLRSFITIFQENIPGAYEQAQLALQQLPQDDLFFRSIVAWLMGITQAWSEKIRKGIQSLDQALQMSIQSGNIMMAVASMSNQAELLMYLGDLRAAQERYVKALQMAIDSQGRTLPVAGIVMIGQGDLEREWNHLETAERLLTQGIELTLKWGRVGAFDGYIALARLYQAKGDSEKATQTILEARRLAELFDTTYLDDLLVSVYQAQLWVAQGDLQNAEGWAQKRLATAGQDLDEIDQNPFRAYTLCLEGITLAWLHIVQGQNEAALSLLERLTESLVEQERIPGQIQSYVLRALALHGMGKKEPALSALAQALALGEPQGFLRLFLDFGPLLIHLLEEYSRRKPPSAYVQHLLDTDRRMKTGLGPVIEDISASGLVEPLSDREREVLRLLDSSLSNQEIGVELFIATSTVKTHINNLYRKLGVEKRTQAVAHARELGLIP